MAVAGYLGSLAVMAQRHRRHLITDEHEDAVRSLEWAAELSGSASRDPHMWKWILISLHNATQGYMVSALWDGNGLRALREKIAKKWLRAHYSDTPYPFEMLDDFPNLYLKVKARRGGKSAFSPGLSHDESLAHLNSYRNEFMHFTPKHWCLELALLPPMCRDALDLVEFLGWKPGQILWHKQSHMRRGKSAVHRMRQSLRPLLAVGT